MQQERKRLQAIIAAFEALYEFHRIEKWLYVHLFYVQQPSLRELLQHKQDIMERHASTLFEMLRSNEKLAKTDDAHIREFTKVRFHTPARVRAARRPLPTCCLPAVHSPTLSRCMFNGFAAGCQVLQQSADGGGQ